MVSLVPEDAETVPHRGRVVLPVPVHVHQEPGVETRVPGRPHHLRGPCLHGQGEQRVRRLLLHPVREVDEESQAPVLRPEEGVVEDHAGCGSPRRVREEHGLEEMPGLRALRQPAQVPLSF
jgi:hypothetical protein